MKNKGFTLIELLATVVLLGLIFAITFPKILEVIERKENEMDDATLKLIYNGAEKYMANDLEKYPDKIGSEYCISLKDIDEENLIPVSIDKYLDKIIKIKIGKNNNSYKVENTCSICNNAECFSYSNSKYNIPEISVKEALDNLYTKLK